VAIAELAGVIDTAAATAAWDAVLAAPEWAGPPVWVHGDLMPGNMLPAGAREIFRDALAPDDATWARSRGWALSMALIQLPYYQDTNPGIAANARHVIRAVLSG
jgi:aminoglycoside phosphotransferase (APT) family kinase protein